MWRRCKATRRISWEAIRCVRSRMSTTVVKSALEALSGVAVTKLSNATNRQEWQVTFQGSLAGTNVAQTTVATGSLTTMGCGPTAIQETDTQGGTSNEVKTVTLSNATDGVFRLAFGGMPRYRHSRLNRNRTDVIQQRQVDDLRRHRFRFAACDDPRRALAPKRTQTRLARACFRANCG